MPPASRPMVSVIVPCRDEERYIAGCLDSILGSDYPRDRMEVLVVDGMSTDATRTVVAEYARTRPSVRLLENPKAIAPSALNIGIRAARGDVIVRMDAHVVYPPDYVSRLVDAMEESGADNVGGVIVTLPAEEAPVARAIALGLSHPFGVGNSYFRIGSAERRWVDTVPFGCYRREVFARVGMFDEELVRNQDDEFNFRLIRRGGRILLMPDVVSQYFARASLRMLWRMYFQYGYFKPLVAQKVGAVMTVRQLIPAAFLLALIVTAGLAVWLPAGRILFGTLVGSYLLAALACAVKAGRPYGARCCLALVLVFPLLHFSYGAGFLRRLVEQLLGIGRRPHDVAAVPLSR